MDKEREIGLIKSMKKSFDELVSEDSYFGELFNPGDLEQMIENVKNDFPIEYRCEFCEKDRRKCFELEMNLESQKMSYEQHIGVLEYEYHEKMLNFAEKVLKASDYSDASSKVIGEEVGQNEVVKIKLRNGIALSSDEIRLVCSMI